MDSSLCLGCWIGWLEMEKFLIRATGGTFWSLGVYDAMKEFIKLAEKHQPRVR